MPDVPLSSPILRLDPPLPKKEFAKIRDNFSAVVLHGSHLWLGGDEGTSIARMTRDADGTITEQRANAIFAWLRDFGLRFAWRQTGTLPKLQMEVNQGAIGLIIARRIDNERPGHLTVIIPETGDAKAKRAENGDVVAPLQSKAATNFRRGTGKLGWWKGTQFAESAFWLHA